MEAKSPIFKEAIRFWLKLGFVSFGGPTAQIAMMHEEIVERRKWISEADFLSGLNFCMMLPGPEAQQLATYIGWRMHGVRGAFVAGGLFVIPAVFILWGFSWLYAQWGSVPFVASLFQGLEVAVVALVAMAIVRIGKKSIKSKGALGLAVGAFLGAFILQLNFLWWVVGLLFSSFLMKRQDPLKKEGGGIDSQWRKIGMEAGLKFMGGFAICFSPILAIGLIQGWSSLGAQLGLFFTKVALLTFGGAYAILPYVSQEAVHHFHWLNTEQMIAGLGLAETTPGPLIMVLQFVGFMAGWLNPEGGSPLGMATFGALITTWVTFFPSFLFIFIGGPLLDRLDSFPVWERFLKWISAAVVGVIGAMAVGFASHVLMVSGEIQWIKIIGVFMALWGIKRWKWSPLVVVMGGAIFGWLISGWPF